MYIILTGNSGFDTEFVFFQFLIFLPKWLTKNPS